MTPRPWWDDLNEYPSPLDVKRLRNDADRLRSALLYLLDATTHDCGEEEERHLNDHLWPAQTEAHDVLQGTGADIEAPRPSLLSKLLERVESAPDPADYALDAYGNRMLRRDMLLWVSDCRIAISQAEPPAPEAK